MIIQDILSILIAMINAIFSFLPAVTALPSIGGYDIDGALVSGVSQAYTFADSVWPIKDVLIGAAFMWGYYGVKLALRLFLGSRAPASYG